MTKREKQAFLILSDPSSYKICEGCDSIVTKKTVICPSCKAYKFNSDINTLKEHCIKLALNDQKSVQKEDLY